MDSFFQNIPDKVVVLKKLRQIIMSATVYSDQRDAPGKKFLQVFAMFDGDEPVVSAVNNIYREGYF